MKRAFTVLLALGVTTASPHSYGATTKHFTVTDDISLTHFGDLYTGEVEPVTFSPDGLHFVVDAERGRIDLNRPESTLRVYRTESVRRFLSRSKNARRAEPFWTLRRSTFHEGPIITHVRWLPDSSGFVYLEKTATGNERLFLASLQTRTVSALTPADQYVVAFDCHDPKHYVYGVLDPNIRSRAARDARATAVVGTGRLLDSLLFREDEDSHTSKYYDLSDLWAVIDGRRFRVQEESGRPFQLHRAGQQALALSPNGKLVATALAVRSVPKDWETQYPSPERSVHKITAGEQNLDSFAGQFFVSEYVQIVLSTGEARPLTRAPIGNAVGWEGLVSANWSADSGSVVLANTFLEARSRGAISRPCVAVVDVLHDAAACLEQTKEESEDGWRSIAGVRFAAGSRTRVTVEFLSPTGAARVTTYERSEEGSWVMVAAEDVVQTRSLEISINEGLNKPPALVATDFRRNLSHVIWDPNRQLRNIELGDVSVYQWKDKTGRAWRGGLYKPPSYVPNRRYPLVIQTHGFDERYFLPSGLFPTAFAARELAGAGIIALQVSDCPMQNTPDESVCNVTGYKAAIDQLTSDGLADPERVGIIGFSRSCYYVIEALTSDAIHFKAASITDGVNYGYLQYINNVDMYGDTIAHESARIFGARPFGAGLQQWLKRSAVFHMDRVSTPLQVVALKRTGVLTMWEPYAALRYLNKAVDLVVLNSDEHVLTNPAMRVASQGGTVDWFRFWLQDYEDPEPLKAAQYKRWRELTRVHDGQQPPPAASSVH